MLIAATLASIAAMQTAPSAGLDCAFQAMPAADRELIGALSIQPPEFTTEIDIRPAIDRARQGCAASIRSDALQRELVIGYALHRSVVEYADVQLAGQGMGENATRAIRERLNHEARTSADTCADRTSDQTGALIGHLGAVGVPANYEAMKAALMGLCSLADMDRVSSQWPR